MNSLSILPLWNDLLALQDEFYTQLIKDPFWLSMVHPYKLNTSKIFLTLTCISKITAGNCIIQKSRVIRVNNLRPQEEQKGPELMSHCCYLCIYTC